MPSFSGSGATNPQTSAAADKLRGFRRNVDSTYQLMQASFLSRVTLPGKYPSRIPLHKVAKLLKPRLTRILDIATAEALTDTAIAVTLELGRDGPVCTGTLVSNNVITTTPNATFNQWIAYFPRIVHGTPEEGVARGIAFRSSINYARRIVSEAVTLGLPNFKIYIMNPTPYRTQNRWYIDGLERSTVNRATAKYLPQAKIAVNARVRQLSAKRWV